MVVVHNGCFIFLMKNILLESVSVWRLDSGVHAMCLQRLGREARGSMRHLVYGRFIVNNSIVIAH